MSKMCHPIAVTLFDSATEPMTAFTEHDTALLESALHNPQYPYYPTISKKAAILYYSIIKNHPFKNGNKRTATASLIVFLAINDSPLVGSKKEIEDYFVGLATKVASSKGSDEKDAFLEEIASWLIQHTDPAIR